MVEKKVDTAPDAAKEKKMPQPTAPASMGEEDAGLGAEAEAQKAEKEAAEATSLNVPEEAPVVKVEVTKGAVKATVVDKFVKFAGVPKSDVIAFNEDAGTVVTKQGGKFKLRGTKGKFMKLLGPDLAEDEEDEDEE